MKKIACLLASAAAVLLLQTGVYANPSCVLMRFTDDTRFERIDTAGTLSDLLLEKLLNSGKFNFKETNVIPENMEKILYDERTTMFENARYGIANGNFSGLFEGQGFREELAESIASAQLGQLVSPEIVGRIGREHGADYLLQGTILNVGIGNWQEDPTDPASRYISESKAAIGVQADMKLIKVSTGEVVWKKEISATKAKKKVSVLFIPFGSDKLSEELYYKTVEEAAQKLADALIADINNGSLFVK